MIISFANRKGGVGKSTLLTWTAGALAQRWRVVVVDADLQASIYEQRRADLEDGQQGGFEVVRFAFEKQGAADVPVLRFTRLIGELAGQYDLVLVDAPGTMEGEVIPAVLVLSDAVIVPIIGSVLDINSTVSFLRLVEGVNQQRGGDLRVIGVVNKKDRTSEYGQLAGLEGVGGLHLMRSQISNRVEYRRLSTVRALTGGEFSNYINELIKVLEL